MAFTQTGLERSFNQVRGAFATFVYRTNDTIATVVANGYFNRKEFGYVSIDAAPHFVNVYASDGYYTVKYDFDNEKSFFAGASPDLLNINNRVATDIINLDYISSPVEIPNLALWLEPNGFLKSDYTKPIEGDSVSFLQDGSGNGRHATLQAGSASFSAAGGYGGKSGFLLAPGSRFQTDAFVDAGYGSALTTFVVTKEPSPLHSSLKVKLSFSGTSAWQGNTGTTGNRDYTFTGLTGYSAPNAPTQSIGGIDYVSIGTSQVRISSNGEGLTGNSSGSTDIEPITGGAIPFSASRVIIGGLTNSATYDWLGAISEVIVFNRELTENELRQVRRYLTDKYNEKTTVVFNGNSLTSGTGSTSGANQRVSVTGDNLPSIFLNSNPQFDVRTDAFPGRTGESLFNNTHKYSGIAYDSKKVINVVWEGTNSLPASNSPQEAYDWIRRICLQKAASSKVIVMTVMYRSDVADVPKNNALTDQLNQLIRDNYNSFATDLLDVAADPRLIDPTDTTYFAGDDVHLNSTGYAVVSELLTLAI